MANLNYPQLVLLVSPYDRKSIDAIIKELERFQQTAVDGKAPQPASETIFESLQDDLDAMVKDGLVSNRISYPWGFRLTD